MECSLRMRNSDFHTHNQECVLPYWNLTVFFFSHTLTYALRVGKVLLSCHDALLKPAIEKDKDIISGLY